MDTLNSVLDAIAAFVARAAESWLGTFVLLSPIWLGAAVWIRRGLVRRRAFRDFAAARQLQFVGIIPSDARPPYSRIHDVRSAALLSNVVEGQWDGLPIRVFDMPWRRGRGRTTAFLVTVEGRLLRGPAADRVIAAGPEAFLDTNLDILCVCPLLLLDPSELAGWLSFAVTLAKAMERDAQDSAASETPDEAPPPARSITGERRRADRR